MPVTHVGAIYVTKSKHLLGIYVPDSNAELDRLALPDGASMLRVPIEVHRVSNHLHIQALVGTPDPGTGDCALVHKDTRLVIDRIVADPEFFKHPDGHLVVRSDTAAHGDHWDGEKFVKKD